MVALCRFQITNHKSDPDKKSGMSDNAAHITNDIGIGLATMGAYAVERAAMRTTTSPFHYPSLNRGMEDLSNSSEILTTINPQIVRFSQNSIGNYFRNGQQIDDLALALSRGTITPGDVSKIRLVNHKNNLYTLDNRRLAAFRKADVDVPYRMATSEEIAAEAWKFTTKNEGISIRIRGQQHGKY
jgi:hypothetical protein